MHEKLLTDQKCLFYTTVDQVKIFCVLHDKNAPLIMSRSEHEMNREQRLSKTTPIKFWSDTKLSSGNEFLMTLMKLRLGFLITYLSQRFGISGGLCTQFFNLWIRGMAESFKPVINTISATTPEMYM